MSGILRRIEKIETAVAGSGIPTAERMQVIKGKMEGGRFTPDAPEDSVERRKEALTRRYGTAEGAVFVRLVDYYG